MKILALLLIVGALTVYASAFSGVWTAPGLEEFPTYADVIALTPWGAPAEPESGIIPLAAGVQFRAHGVESGPRGERVLLLPEPKPQERQLKSAAQAAAPVPARPRTPTPVRRAAPPAKPKAPQLARRTIAPRSYGYGSASIRSTSSYSGSRTSSAATRAGGGIGSGRSISAPRMRVSRRNR